MNSRKTSIEFLQDLIRIDTQNPPGNELAAALYIKEHADCLKIDSQLFTYDGNRGNIVIHLGPADERRSHPPGASGYRDCRTVRLDI